MHFVEEIYRISNRFPKAEIYGLTSQLRRGALSVPCNIAEGRAKKYTKEFLRFIDIASGSVAEVQTQLMLALRLNFMTGADYEALRGAIDEIGRMLFGLERSLMQKVAA